MMAKASQYDMYPRSLLHLWHLCCPHSIVDSCISCSSQQWSQSTLSIHLLCQVALEPLAKIIVHAANQKAMAVAIADAATANTVNTVNTVSQAATLGLDGISLYFKVFHGD